MKDIAHILINAQNFGEALGSIYRCNKKTSPRYSLAYLCRVSGIRSKGYLSDVMSGRRTLNLKYLLSLSRAMKLQEKHKQLFITLALVEAEKDPHQKKAYRQKVSSLKKALKVEYRKMPQGLYDPLVMVRVFCTLGLFREPPTIQNLLRKLKNIPLPEIEQSLNFLITQDAVIEENQRYRVKNEQIIFNSAENDKLHFRFITSCLEDAHRNLEKYFQRPNESYFESTLISVRSSVYKEKLVELKEFLNRYQSDIESSDADSLIHFNIQVYPANPVRPPVTPNRTKS